MAKLCKSKKTVNSNVNPKAWYYGLEHCRMTTFAAIPTGETILPINIIQEDYSELLGYIHFTNGAADPAPVGLTNIATVDVSGAADVDAVYAAMEVALEAGTYAGLYQVSATAGEGVDMINNFIGSITEESGDTSGAVVTIGQQSFGGALGVLTEDGASASFEFETLDQTGDSTGSAIIESFLIGITATVGMSLTDTSRAQFEEMFINPLGGKYVNGLDEVIGFGTDSFFKSLLAKAGKLVGHDAGVAYTDRSNDWSMLASIKPSSINFNKELQVIETEFISYYDATAPEEVNIFKIGDFSVIDLESL